MPDLAAHKRLWEAAGIPYGLCLCGCGQPTNIAPRTFDKHGWIKGEPYRCVRFHSRQRVRSAPPNPSGLCLCGCGRTTPISRNTNRAAGHAHGEHVRYIAGHNMLPRGKGDQHRYVKDERGCWVWLGALDTSGYGTLTLPGNLRNSAHRHHYELRFGAIDPGIELHHTCHVRRCVNPDHLQPVTRLEHARLQGKLSMEKARAIRVRFAAGESKASLGREYGVNSRTVKDVVDGRTWREDA